MGMLMDFYAGDEARIVAACRGDDLDALEAPGVVAAHADLSLHLGPEELDHLVAAACELGGRPALTFEGCLLDGGDPQDASGVHRLSDAFRDLLAGLTPAQAAALADRWVARWPPEPPAAPRRRGALAKVRDGLERAAVAAVLVPALGVMWLSSRSFREARRQGLAARAAAAVAAPVEASPATQVGEPLRQAVAELVGVCRTARSRGTRVVYAWSL